MFCATARAANADFLISEDKDQLVIAECEGTHIVNCQTFLAILQHDGEDQ